MKVYVVAKWLCYLCERPLIFPPVMRQLANLTVRSRALPPLAYYNANWRRDLAPLLDELGASVDHKEPLAGGGAHHLDNFAAICARCNARKGARAIDVYLAEANPWKVRGPFGPPQHWDGLASVFVSLAANPIEPLTSTDKAWLKALRVYYSAIDQPAANSESEVTEDRFSDDGLRVRRLPHIPERGDE
ncbi:MAG: HNH endonuclease [Gemmatimonadales bacterium]